MGIRSAVSGEKAWAKINLTLEVLGRRDDGYHDIASVIQVIDLGDDLTFEAAEGLRLSCNLPEMASPQNLVVKAARMLQEVAGRKLGASICLEKAVPLASGLGGGSSDAAATLRALNQMWGLNLDRERLRGIAARLGSDVPFFLAEATTALVQGRGDQVIPLSPLPETWFVLVRPPVTIANKTRQMYSRLDVSHFTAGEHTRRMVQLIEGRRRVSTQHCYNAFDSVAFSFWPQLEDCRLRFLATGASQVHLAGSGPTLFTLVADKAQGEEICLRLKRERVEGRLVRSL